MEPNAYGRPSRSHESHDLGALVSWEAGGHDLAGAALTGWAPPGGKGRRFSNVRNC